MNPPAEPWQREVEQLRPGDHACLLWETEEDHRAAVTHFLVDGLTRGEKILYLIDSHAPSLIVDYLDQAGVNIGRCLASGQLTTLDAGSVYLRGGFFDVERMIQLLRDETAQALDAGYPALRVTGEMGWAFCRVPGTEQLFDYESRLNAWFPLNRCLALCQYSCQEFPPSMLWRSVVTHPTIAINGRRYRNRYYIAPPTFLDPHAREALMSAQLEQPGALSAPPQPVPGDYRDIGALLQAAHE